MVRRCSGWGTWNEASRKKQEQIYSICSSWAMTHLKAPQSRWEGCSPLGFQPLATLEEQHLARQECMLVASSRSPRPTCRDQKVRHDLGKTSRTLWERTLSCTWAEVSSHLNMKHVHAIAKLIPSASNKAEIYRTLLSPTVARKYYGFIPKIRKCVSVVETVAVKSSVTNVHDRALRGAESDRKHWTK